MIEVRVPDEQEGTKAVVRAWLKKVGEAVAVNDPLVELETDKVTQEVPSPAAGVLTEILLDTDDEAEPGALLARITAGVYDPLPFADTSSPAKAGAESSAAGAAAQRSGPVPSQGNGEQETRLSPSVRRALLQHNIDPSRIQGTGRGGRITRDDVDRAVASATTVTAGEPATAQPRQFSPQDIPHDRMRLKIAENMVRAVSEAPHVTALFEADFSAIAAHKAAMAAKGVKLSYTAYLIKAAAEAMAVAPAINGRWGKGSDRGFADDQCRRRHRTGPCGSRSTSGHRACLRPSQPGTSRCIPARSAPARRARHVKIAGRNIHELASMPVAQLHEFLAGLARSSLDVERGEIAEAILFLVSERSSFITGHALVVDGGESLAGGANIAV